MLINYTPCVYPKDIGMHVISKVNNLILMNYKRTLDSFALIILFLIHMPLLSSILDLFFSSIIYTLLIVLFNWFLLRYTCIFTSPLCMIAFYISDLPFVSFSFSLICMCLNFSLLKLINNRSLRIDSLTLVPGHHLWGWFESTVI